MSFQQNRLMIYQAGVQLFGVAQKVEDILKKYGVQTPEFRLVGDGGERPFRIIGGNDDTKIFLQYFRKEKVPEYGLIRMRGQEIGRCIPGRPFDYTHHELKRNFGTQE